MSINLKYIINNIFKNKDEKYFYRFIGIENKDTFNDELKTLQDKCIKFQDKCVIFDNEIPLSAEMELIQYIYNELQTMDISNLVNQEIVIFDEFEVNYKFLQALQYCVDLSIRNENFFNVNIRNNFITKLIVWVYMHIKNIDLKSYINPSCIYYGNIQRHEIYFLILLYKMGFDVIYINPLKEEEFDSIDTDNISICIKNMQIDIVDTFEDRCKKGNIIDTVETVTKQIQQDIHKEIFENTGIFRPWQFRNGYTKSILLDTILEDIYIYYNEPSKLREGFGVDGSIVKVPCFFKKIDGQNLDLEEYKKLVKYCSESIQNTLFFNNGNISNDKDLSGDMFKLMFCQLSDGSFDIEEIKKLELYRYSKYSNEVQDFILNKFNELIKRDDLYVDNLDNESILKLLVLVLSLSEDIIRLIDNFDFVGYVPKIVIYLNNEDEVSYNMTLLLGYLHNIGIDIIIFNPSGLFNITNIIKSDKINIDRLENINYKSTYKELMNTKINVFSKLFK